jgi:hypothetical protein
MKNDKLKTWNAILSIAVLLLFIGMMLLLDALDKEKNKYQEYTADISNFQEDNLNQTIISYVENDTRVSMSFYERKDYISGWYVGNTILNKSISFDLNFNTGECTLTIYRDFIEGKGNPEENYIITGNITNSSGFSFGRTR